jgi:hypothetical protein
MTFQKGHEVPKEWRIKISKAIKIIGTSRQRFIF